MKSSTEATDTSTNSSPAEEDDWNLPCDFHLFAQYETRQVYCSPSRSFEMKCVESLTPIDMMNLSNGVHDATGFCVWTGSFLFIAALPTLTASYFSGKDVLELGCGTGIDGIALFLSPEKDTGTAWRPPNHLVLTDADPGALELCRSNMLLAAQNQKHISEDQYTVRTLTWGEDCPASLRHTFHTAYAADILYDIDMLPRILHTVHQCLIPAPGSSWILSHVPRACYRSHHVQEQSLHEKEALSNTEEAQAKSSSFVIQKDNLEDFIIEQTIASGLELVTVIRPEMLPSFPIPPDALNAKSLQEMQEIGASILVFSLP